MGSIKHAKNSQFPNNPADPTKVGGEDWNGEHEFDLAVADIAGLESRLLPVDQVVQYRNEALGFRNEAAQSAADAADLVDDFATPGGAELIGTPTGSVQAALDARITQAALSAAATIPAYAYTAAEAQSILDNALPMQSYTALRAYTGRALAVRITTPGIAGLFQRDLVDVATADDWGTVIVDASNRRWKRVYSGTLEVCWFGAVGDGVTDDGVALNRAFAAVRARIMASPWDSGSLIVLDGGSRSFKTTISVDATKLMGGWCFQNASVQGSCTGKATIDAIGSRDGIWSNLMIYGDPLNVPTTGMQCARALDPLYGFCDGIIYDNVRARGHFSIAAHYAYGQESTVHYRCKWWNSLTTGRAAVLQGYDTIQVASDYCTPMTGATSYINVKYINTEFVYLPLTNQANITGISKAASAVVTVPGHSFLVGQNVTFGYVGGMTQMNNLVGTISATTATTITVNINSTGFSTFTSGGITVRVQTVPTVAFNRGQEHDFDTCYFVAYGYPQIEIAFPDGFPLQTIKFDSTLFEGNGNASLIRFTQAGTITDFVLNTYNVNSRDAVIDTSIGAGTVSLPNAKIQVQNTISASTPLLISPVARFSLLMADVAYPTGVTFDPKAYAATFTGRVRTLADGNVVQYGVKTASYRDGVQVTTALTSTTGTLGAGASAYVTTRYMGDLCFYTVEASVPLVGSGAGGLKVTMPFFTGAVSSTCTGKEISVNGRAVTGYIPNASNQLSFINNDGTTTPIVAGGNYSLSGVATVVP